MTTVGFFYLDMQYMLWVLVPTLGLSLFVQLYLKSTYARYTRVGNRRGVTGAEAARQILDRSGIHDVRVEEVSGFLSDHYDPTHKVLRLSPENYRGASLAAVGVAAHEAGHAVQHARRYAPLALRNAAVPAASIGSSFGYIVCIIGLMVGSLSIGWAGVLLLGAVALFQIINLPVEFDASRRALQLLPETGILSREEVGGARKVLVAAALTYVAATIAAVWTMLYFAMRLGLLGGRDE